MPDNGDVGDGKVGRFASDEVSSERATRDLIERAAPIAGIGLTAAAIASNAAAEAVSTVLAPVIGTAIAGLVPVVIEALRRRDIARSEGVERAHAAARLAWIEEAARHGREVTL